MSAIVFPGQGSQYLKMAMDFNDNFDAARDTFQVIEEACKLNIRKIINENPSNKLNQTNFTQISIFAASLAIYNTFIDQVGFELINPEVVLGHSLGEYSALVANKMISLVDASNLIKKRGELMNSSVEPNKSGMAAVIGKDAKFINALINSNNLDIVIANDNSPMQVVVSGLISAINDAEAVFSSNGVKRYIKLNVSAAFHSKYMEDAEKKLIQEIDTVIFKKSEISIISNYDASQKNDLNKIKSSLKKQMSNQVRWTESIRQLERTNITKIYEIGPGKVLSGLISRISNKFDIKTIDKIQDLNKFN